MFPVALWAFALGCTPPQPAADTRPFDVAIVPGCPSEDDGRLSACQWRRAAWAADLYHRGVVSRLLVSGSAVHNRHVEAEALATGLIALGVPDAQILREPNALHTDQNIAFALSILSATPDWTVGVASDALQAPGCCAMWEAWSDRACVAFPLTPEWARARARTGFPEARTEPVAAWLPLDERERRIAEMTGFRRGNSMAIYTGKALLNVVGRSAPPPLPPTLEETLAFVPAD